MLKNASVLEGSDGEFLRDYFAVIGKTEAKSQIDYLNERKQVLKKYKDESEQEYKKYSSLYLKISLMVGILIAVLLA
jgi:stage III sporulation protein AB